MNQFHNPRLNEEDFLSSTSSDEKMDTGSESLRSARDTPNSILSDDDREPDVLRLQNPTARRPPAYLDDSFVTKMSGLTLDSPDARPTRLGATLTITTDHPLMSPGSPDDNFPDVIPKRVPKIDLEKDSSLSPVEDGRGIANGYEFYSPQRNTSKNNLYFSDNFVTADSHVLGESFDTPPDIARAPPRGRRKIVAKISDTPIASSPFGKLASDEDDRAVRVADGSGRHYTHSTPERSHEAHREEFHSAAEWRDGPDRERAAPAFDLPIEMSADIGTNDAPGSPEALSSSTQADRSAYQALLDPYTGSVALRPAPRRAPTPRRKVQLPPEEDDCCSLDSVSGCSLDSEEEPPAPADCERPHIDRNTRASPSPVSAPRSRSTNTASECSDPIPEYSAAEEFRDERSWLAVGEPRAAACDMKVIEPFKRVVSHGGYSAEGAALIVFSACHLPDSARPDYRYVMDNLFLYVMWSLERLVTDEYVLVYLHGSAGRRRMPGFSWLHECYKLVDRRLRKSLKHLYLVHPTFWLKSFVIITKPFVSSKFFRKLTYVKNLDELLDKVPVEPNAIPDLVKQFDQRRR